MERLQELITQLKEQFERQGDLSQLIQTTRMLEAELARLSGQATLHQNGANRGSAKVAVMMPSSMKMYAGQQAVSDVPVPVIVERGEGKAEIKNLNELRGGQERSGFERTPAEKNQQERTPFEKTPAEIPPAERSVTEFPLSSKNSVRPVAAPKENRSYPFDPLSEIPTLAQQQVPRELNDVIAGNNGFSSRNDSLKVNVVELSAALNEAPVRDLKKAIGVNDRYIFISQLFRGDEVMYERSIKTINGFRILPEAEYWMERELKVKLGWDENREATRHFYQLVKRRFA
ncbi:hypothetical protein ACX0G9_16045 [Flavitalea flava]